MYSRECRQSTKRSRKRWEGHTGDHNKQTTTNQKHQPAAPNSPTSLLLSPTGSSSYTNQQQGLIQLIYVQQAITTTNICELAHIIINQSAAADNYYIYCTNSNWKCEYVTEWKMTLTTNVWDINASTIIDISHLQSIIRYPMQIRIMHLSIY